MPTMTALWKKFMDDEPVPDCGENPSPMTYCGPPLDSVAGWSMGVRGRYVFALFGSLAYLGLAIDQFSYAFHGKISTVAGKLGRPNHGSKAMRFARRAWPWVRDIYWFIVEAILLLGTLLYYAILLEASPQARISDSSEWSFGQLIAVMVWAPTIVKYIYFNICKSDVHSRSIIMVSSRHCLPHVEGRPARRTCSLISHHHSWYRGRVRRAHIEISYHFTK